MTNRLAHGALAVLLAWLCVSCSSSSDADTARGSESNGGGPATPSVIAPEDRVDVEPAPGSAVATDQPSLVDGSGAVDVQITFSGWDPASSDVVVGAFVSGVVETGGTCTLVLTLAGSTASSTSVGEPDASTVSCGDLTVPGSSLGAGSWNATVSYQSDTVSGTSDSVSVQVPAS